MRITIVIGAFLPMPPAQTGAIEKVWDAMAHEFARRGHRVCVVCPAADGEGREVRQDSEAGVRVIRRSRWRRTGSTKLDLVKDFLYSCGVLGVLPDADVTVTNCFWLPAILRVMRRPRIGALNVHAQRFPKGQFGLYRGAARISTVSDAIAEAIRSQTPRVADLVKVIPNPVDVGVFRPVGEEDRDPATRRILFTGRIHPEKGLELLVRAFASLWRRDDSVRLRLIGPSDVDRGGGGPAYVARLREIAGAAPLELLPAIAEPSRLAVQLRSCDVYCYPSLAYFGEASPVAPLEAMASGAVPVVSDLPQFGGYVRDGETGLVFAREAVDAEAQLAERLGRVLEDAPLAARLRTAGVERAQAFSVERIADAYLEDFAALAGVGEETRESHRA